MKNTLIYKAKQFMLNFLHEKSTYFRKQCKWCASRWYWKSNCLIFKYNINIKLMIFYNFCNDTLKCIMNSRNMKKSNFKIFTWNLHSKLDLVIFLTSVLIISFWRLILIFYIWVFNTIIEVAMEKNSNFLLFLGIWPKCVWF